MGGLQPSGLGRSGTFGPISAERETWKTQNGHVHRVAPSDPTAFSSITDAISTADQGDTILISEDVSEENINPAPDLHFCGPAALDGVSDDTIPKITVTSTDADGFILDSSFNNGTGNPGSGCSFAGLVLDGSYKSGQSAFRVGKGANQLEFRNIGVNGFKRAFYLDGSYSAVYRRCEVRNTDYGVLATKTKGVTTLGHVFTGMCRLVCDVAGAYVGTAQQIMFKDSFFPPGNAGPGIKVVGREDAFASSPIQTKTVTVSGCHIEDTDSHGIHLKDVNGPIIGMGTHFRNAGSTDGVSSVMLQPASNSVVEDGVIAGNFEIGGNVGLQDSGSGVVRKIDEFGNSWGAGRSTSAGYSRPINYQHNNNRYDTNEDFWARSGIITDGSTVDVRGGEIAKATAVELPPQSSPPAGTKRIAIQDGTNWDPAGTGQEELVVRINGAWTPAT